MSALIESLDEDQRKVALSLIGPMVVLAGAGSGKTRAITHRIAYGIETGVYTPDKVLALSFTTKAAGEMRSRLAHLGVNGVACRTFHATALSHLSTFWPAVIGGDLPSVRSGKAALLTMAADQLSLKLTTETLRGVAAEIEWRKVRMMSPAQYADIIGTRPIPQAISPDTALSVMAAYERIKDARRELDFEDVLLLDLGMIENEERVAARIREQLKFFVVDEYQDVSPVQRALLDAWRGERADVCVVGDPNQTIFSFAGASAEHLLKFEREFAGAKSVVLENNYRSTPEIVRAANHLIPESPIALRAVGEHGPAPITRVAPTDADEARMVAEDIRAAILAGEQPQNMAVLYRINAQSVAIETALAEAGIPFRVRGARFFDEQVVKETLMLLRGAQSQDPEANGALSLDVVIRERFAWSSKPPESAPDRHVWTLLNSLVTIARDLPAQATVASLVKNLTERAERDSEPAISAVTLSTIHGAKGLEWDRVFIIGMSEGLLPLSLASTEVAVAEERRLAYVGITRAGRSLTMSWAQQQGAQSARRTPSRFLASV
ncbi:MAG: ATP-dependent helicase [Microbacteriaceae bacterium]